MSGHPVAFFGAKVPALSWANPLKFESFSMNWNTRRIMDVPHLRALFTLFGA